MGWKIPIDTDIFSKELYLGALGRAVWLEILGNCKREPTTVTFYSGKKRYSVVLGVGETVFNLSDFCRETGASRKRVLSTLRIINTNFQELDIEGKPFGYIIKLKNYLDIIKMKNERNTKGDQKVSEGNSYYIGEECKSDKRGENARARKAPLGFKDDQGDVCTTPPVPATPYGSKVLKDYMGIKEWVDPQNEIQCAKDLEFLEDEIGIEEFNRRFQELLADPFHSKRFNEIKYIYLQMRSYKSKIN